MHFTDNDTIDDLIKSAGEETSLSLDSFGSNPAASGVGELRAKLRNNLIEIQYATDNPQVSQLAENSIELLEALGLQEGLSQDELFEKINSNKPPEFSY